MVYNGMIQGTYKYIVTVKKYSKPPDSLKTINNCMILTL